MRTTLCTGLALALVAITGCEAPDDQPGWWDLEISSRAFVALPCGDASAQAPCTLIVAGGKRILIGAPAGAAQSLRPQDLRQLDAVFVFSLHSTDIEGLDEVRNQSWHLGRLQPLPVIGPAGIEQVATGINLAFEQADALFVVDQGIPPGGYDAAVLVARTAGQDGASFDTGDLQLYRSETGYVIAYDDRRAEVSATCFNGADSSSDSEPLLLTVGCDGDAAWPLSAPVFIE